MSELSAPSGMVLSCCEQVMHVIAVAFDWQLFHERLISPGDAFWTALFTTAYISIIAEVLGVVLGMVLFSGSRARLLPVRIATYAYLLIFRGTPLIVQIFFIYFGANLFLGFELFPNQVSVLGLSISGAVIAGIVALALNEGAYMSEIIRAGIDSIDPGQLEAAKSIGMTRRMGMRRIVLPQAARVIIPPLGNQFNYMLKTTALLAFIGVYELFNDAQSLYSVNFKPVEVFAAVAGWYLLLTTVWSLIQVQIERKFEPGKREGEGWLSRILGVQAETRSAP